MEATATTIKITWIKLGGAIASPKITLQSDGQVIAEYPSYYTPGEARALVIDAVLNAVKPACPEGCYWRGTNNKQELDLIASGKLSPSRNHADGCSEAGLSVIDSAAYIGVVGYKYGYLVAGEIIGHGSDGEPLLDVNTLKPQSKMMTRSQILKSDQASKAKLIEQIGWTRDQVAAVAGGQFDGPGW